MRTACTLSALLLAAVAGLSFAEELSPEKSEAEKSEPNQSLFHTAVASDSGYVAVNRDGELTKANLEGEATKLSDATFTQSGVAVRNGNVLVCDGETIREVNMKTGKAVRSAKHIGGPVGYASNDRIFVLTGGTVDFIDLNTGETTTRLELLDAKKSERYAKMMGRPEQFCVADETLYVAGARRSAALAIDLKSEKKIKEFKVDSDGVFGLQVSGDSLFLLTGMQGYGVVYYQFELVNLKSGKHTKIKLPRTDEYKSIVRGYYTTIVAEPEDGVAMILDGMLLRYDKTGKLISKKDKAVEPRWQLIASNGKEATVSTLTELKTISVK